MNRRTRAPMQRQHDAGGGACAKRELDEGCRARSQHEKPHSASDQQELDRRGAYAEFVERRGAADQHEHDHHGGASFRGHVVRSASAAGGDYYTRR